MRNVEANRERTGWRDAAISGRHRRWGVACHACDIDFLLVEHYFGVPVALVEYKAFGAREDFRGANYDALRWLGNSCGLPFVVAVYDPETWGIRAFPMNLHAQRDFNWGDELTEREWVAWLHRVRGRAVDTRVAAELNDALPRRSLSRTS